MKTISMLELRKDSAAVLDALKKGVRLVLTYRGRPVARVEPIAAEPVLDNDPLSDIAQLAVASPLGALKHKDIDAALYE